MGLSDTDDAARELAAERRVQHRVVRHADVQRANMETSLCHACRTLRGDLLSSGDMLAGQGAARVSYRLSRGIHAVDGYDEYHPTGLSRPSRSAVSTLRQASAGLWCLCGILFRSTRGPCRVAAASLHANAHRRVRKACRLKLPSRF